MFYEVRVIIHAVNKKKKDLEESMCVLLSERCNLALIACTSCHVSSSTFLPTFFTMSFSHTV